MEGKIKLLISTLGEDRVKINVDLTEFLQTGLGGIARALYIATTTRELIKVIVLCREIKINFLIIGCGSKIAVGEKGLDGLAIKNRSDNLRIFGIKGRVSRVGIGIEEAFLEADSGVSLAKLSDFAFGQGLAGLEVLKSLPGTVGGSFYINPTLRNRASQIKILGAGTNIKSVLPHQMSKSDIILSVVFKLQARKV